MSPTSDPFLPTRYAIVRFRSAASPRTGRASGSGTHWKIRPGCCPPSRRISERPIPSTSSTSSRCRRAFGGAMENVGAITYDESLVLMDANAPVDQRRDVHHPPCARDGAHVVRRPRHAGVVERHLAERSLCHLDGGQGGAGLLARGRVRSRDAEGRARRDGGRFTGRGARDPPAGQRQRRGQRRVRRHHLPERRRRACPCWNASSASGSSATACVST